MLTLQNLRASHLKTVSPTAFVFLKRYKSNFITKKVFRTQGKLKDSVLFIYSKLNSLVVF